MATTAVKGTPTLTRHSQHVSLRNETVERVEAYTYWSLTYRGRQLSVTVVSDRYRAWFWNENSRTSRDGLTAWRDIIRDVRENDSPVNVTSPMRSALHAHLDVEIECYRIEHDAHDYAVALAQAILGQLREPSTYTDEPTKRLRAFISAHWAEIGDARASALFGVAAAADAFVNSYREASEHLA